MIQFIRQMDIYILSVYIFAIVSIWCLNILHTQPERPRFAHADHFIGVRALAHQTPRCPSAVDRPLKCGAAFKKAFGVMESKIFYEKEHRL